MGFLDRLFGRREEPRAQPAAPPTYSGDEGRQPADADEQALQRYRYMLRTAPPETIEQAHEEAFAKLTPAQRARALRELATVTPESERVAGDRDDPRSLARLATRAEMRQPGTVERLFGGTGRGYGMGGMGMMGGMGGSIFGSLVGSFVGSMIAQEFLGSVGDLGFDGGDQSDYEGTDAYTGDDSGDYGSDDYGGGDSGGGDYGGDDYGSGGFDGGDFGGGDFGGGF